MTERAEQLQNAAKQVEGWLDRMIVSYLRTMCIACGITGVIVGDIL